MTVYGPRTRDKVVLSSDQATCVLNNNGYLVTYYHGLDFGRDQHGEDVVTEFYSAKLQRGDVVNNPCSFLRSEWKFGSGGVDKFTRPPFDTPYEFTGATTRHHSNLLNLKVGTLGVGEALNLYEEVAGLVNDAKLLALSRIDSTPFNFGEDVLEIRETLRFLRNPLRSIREWQVRHLRRLRAHQKVIRRRRKPRTETPISGGFLSSRTKEEAVELLKLSNELYLQYRFALSPLVRSVYDAVSALTTRQVTMPPRRTSRAFKRKVREVPYLDYDHNLTADGYLVNGSSRVSVEVNAGVLYRVTNPIEDARHLLGVRPKDWPGHLWAIFPYSFLIDRFLDISSSIAAFTNLSDIDVEILGAWVVEKKNIDNQISISLIDVVGGFDLVSNTASLDTYHEGSYERVVWDPELSDTFPRFNLLGLVDDVQKTADLVSLVLNFFKHYIR